MYNDQDVERASERAIELCKDVEEKLLEERKQIQRYSVEERLLDQRSVERLNLERLVEEKKVEEERKGKIQKLLETRNTKDDTDLRFLT